MNQDFSGALYRRGSTTTERLQLVPFDEQFINENYLNWLNDKALLRFSENRHRSFARADAVQYLAAKRVLGEPFWAVVRQNDEAYLGTISAGIDRANRVADLGILIGASSYTRQGYGREAWEAAMQWLFAQGIRKIEAGAMETNVAMVRIFQRTMTIEGRRPAHFMNAEKTVDLILAGRLSSVRAD